MNVSCLLLDVGVAVLGMDDSTSTTPSWLQNLRLLFPARKHDVFLSDEKVLVVI